MNDWTVFHRSFEYLTPRIRITPNDLPIVNVSKPTTLHFICSPTRAAEIVKEVDQVEGWSPITIYEPIPVRALPLHLLHRGRLTVICTGSLRSRGTSSPQTCLARYFNP